LWGDGVATHIATGNILLVVATKMMRNRRGGEREGKDSNEKSFVEHISENGSGEKNEL
jgi:hypothetical protein